MKTKKSCPCCSHSMLHHLSNKYSYWYCSSCRIEMPRIEAKEIVECKVPIQFNSSSLESTVLAKENIKRIVDRQQVASYSAEY